MTSQDYRVQDNRYRSNDLADDPRRDRYDEARSYQSSRRELPGSAGYGRGRDFGLREFSREGESIDRRYGDPSGRARFEEEYYGGEGGFAGRDSRDYIDRGREPRNSGVADWEAFGRRSVNPYQGGGYRATEYAYAASRDPRFAGDAEHREAHAQGDQGARLRAGWRSVPKGRPGQVAAPSVTKTRVITALGQKITSVRTSAFARMSPTI